MNSDIISTTVKYRVRILILALLGTIGMQGIMALPASENIHYSNSMFSVFAFILMAYMLNNIYVSYKNECNKDKILAGVFSVLLSMALHFGARMEAVENVRMTDISLWVYNIALAVAIMPITCYGWTALEGLFSKLYIKKTEESVSINLYQVWGIIFLLWMPTFLALYPGAFVYDAQDEYIEVISRTFTMHHPLLHVLALGGIVHAAEYIGLTANTGIAIYVLIQMAIMSYVLAYSIKLMERWGLRKGYLTGVMIFYGLFPLFPMYSVCTAKDGLFTTFLLLLVLMLVEFIRGKDDDFFNVRNMVIFVVASTLMMLLRNNGFYAYFVSMPFIWFLGRSDKGEKNKKKLQPVTKLVILMLLSIVLYIGGNYVLKTATHASDNEHQEMLTVPIQQLARVHTYSKDVLTEEELNTLYEVLPEEYIITYRTRVSDVLKSGFDNNAYEKNPTKYRKLWLYIGLRKPLIYINAWFGTNYGYWYPDAINNVYEGNQMYTFQYGESSYFGFETEPPGERDSKFKILERFYKKMSLELFQQKIPVVSMLFAPGLVFWMLGYIIVGLLRNRLKRLIPLMPVALLWLTILLGPTTLVRYVLILWMIIPLYPVLIRKDD